VFAKAKALLVETMANHSFKNEKKLLLEEKIWIGTFTFRDRKKSTVRPSITPGWRLQDTDAVFQAWWRGKAKPRFFSTTPVMSHPQD
jgi:hypothetical protein